MSSKREKNDNDDGADEKSIAEQALQRRKPSKGKEAENKKEAVATFLAENLSKFRPDVLSGVLLLRAPEEFAGELLTFFREPEVQKVLFGPFSLTPEQLLKRKDTLNLRVGAELIKPLYLAGVVDFKPDELKRGRAEAEKAWFKKIVTPSLEKAAEPPKPPPPVEEEEERFTKYVPRPEDVVKEEEIKRDFPDVQKVEEVKVPGPSFSQERAPRPRRVRKQPDVEALYEVRDVEPPDEEVKVINDKAEILIPLVEGTSVEIMYSSGLGSRPYTLWEYLSLKVKGRIPPQPKWRIEKTADFPDNFDLPQEFYSEKALNAIFQPYNNRMQIYLPLMHDLDVNFVGTPIGVTLIADPRVRKITLSKDLVRYKPSYRATRFDRSVVTMTKGSAEEDLYNELKVLASTKYFGAYGPEGQKKRLSQVTEIHQFFLENAVNNPRGVFHNPYLGEGYANYFSLVNMVVPLKTDEYDILNRASDPKKAQELWEKTFQTIGVDPPYSLVALDPASNAGILYPGDKHAERAVDEIINSTIMMNLISTGTNIASSWPFARVYQMKPKPEVYEIPTGEPTKVRNIFASSASFFLPAQVILSLVYHNSPMYWQHVSSRSLYGFSPFKGGTTRFMYYCMNRRLKIGELDFLIYSDNVYLIYQAEGYRWIVSCDGAKQEASHNVTSTRLSATRWLRHAIPELKDESKPWVKYMTEVYPVLTAEGIGVIGSTTLNIPGLGSGAFGTMQLNHEIMAYLMGSFRERFDTSRKRESASSLVELLNAYAEKHGMRLTLESELKIPGTEPPHFFEYFRSRLNDIIPLDLLGFDAMVAEEQGFIMFRPVLKRDRLLNSMMFHKFQHYSKEQEQDELRNNVMKLVIYKVLYSIGGYAFKDTSKVLRNLVVAQAYATNMMGMKYKGITIADVIGSLELHFDPELLSLLNDANIDGVQTLNILHFGGDGVMTKVGKLTFQDFNQLSIKNPTIFTRSNEAKDVMSNGLSLEENCAINFSKGFEPEDAEFLGEVFNNYFGSLLLQTYQYKPESKQYEFAPVEFLKSFGNVDFTVSRYPAGYTFSTVFSKSGKKMIRIDPGIEFTPEKAVPKEYTKEEKKALFLELESKIVVNGMKLDLPPIPAYRYEPDDIENFDEKTVKREALAAVFVSVHKAFPKISATLARSILYTMRLKNLVFEVYASMLPVELESMMCIKVRFSNKAEKVSVEFAPAVRGESSSEELFNSAGLSELQEELADAEIIE